MSEDCLTINILRPSGISSNSRLPVVSVSSYRCKVGSQAKHSYSGRMSQRKGASIFLNMNSSYGGSFDRGASAPFNGSAIVAQSIARVRIIIISRAATLERFSSDLLGHTCYIRKLQLPAWSVRFSSRRRRYFFLCVFL